MSKKLLALLVGIVFLAIIICFALSLAATANAQEPESTPEVDLAPLDDFMAYFSVTSASCADINAFEQVFLYDVFEIDGIAHSAGSPMIAYAINDWENESHYGDELLVITPIGFGLANRENIKPVDQYRADFMVWDEWGCSENEGMLTCATVKDGLIMMSSDPSYPTSFIWSLVPQGQGFTQPLFDEDLKNMGLVMNQFDLCMNTVANDPYSPAQ